MQIEDSIFYDLRRVGNQIYILKISIYNSIVCKTPQVNGTTELEADVSVTIKHTSSLNLKFEKTTTFTQNYHYKVTI